MHQRATEPTRARSLPLMELGSVGLMVALGLATLGLPSAVRAIALIASGVVAGALLLLGSRRRARAVAMLESKTVALRTNPIQSEPLDSRALPREYGALARAIDDVGVQARVQVHEAAKKTRNLEALIDAIDEPILATDSQQRVLLCNRSAERLLESASGELVGRDIRELFTQATILDMHESARHGQTLRQRERITTSLGARVFQVTASPVPAAWGEGVFGAVLALRDVTELATTVQVQTDFVANASHELRTPVAAIRGAAETLQSTGDDPGMSERLRVMILTNAARLEEMLRDLLDLSRLESPNVQVELTTLDFTAITRDIAAMSEEHCAERRLSIEFQIDPSLQHMRSDRKLVTVILRNLVENATKFAHEGTTIRVVGSVIDRPAGGPALVRLSVIDQGIGIPLSSQDRVFERYFQADPGRGSHLKGWRRGTGLGLAIVKHAAQALGGKASLSSVWGQGTTVWVEFPADLHAEPAGLRSTG